MSSYSFETHSRSSSVRVLNIADGSSHIISEDPAASDPVWIAEKDVLYFKAGDKGCTNLWSQHVADASECVSSRSPLAAIHTHFLVLPF